MSFDKKINMENKLFEHTIEFDEETYRAIWERNSTRWLRFTIALVFGIFMLFWSYTLLLGVFVLILCFLYVVSPRILSKALPHNFQGHRYMHQPLKYGVSVEHLWVQGETIDTKASWSLLATWQITRDWLILTPSGIPPVYLPISEMKKAGVFDQIMELAKKNGKEFK
jgi:hypothetical protein